jgi:hypothetical protein
MSGVHRVVITWEMDTIGNNQLWLAIYPKFKELVMKSRYVYGI